ncbi:RNA polymerase sigma factor [uncultured Amnibacterium sp.]|uniref:RNA polymerase sigma factor n=1 Tax=uncultured Amnibacterium sp. TaxID=1631851 RepID=UPI0035CBBF89
MSTTQHEQTARFNAIVGGGLEPVRRYLLRRTDPSTADDVLADVLLVTWRRIDDVPSEPLPWMFRVAANQLRNAKRGLRRQELVAARLADEQRGALDDSHGDAVRLALSSLRPPDAELLRLWAWEGLQPADIAIVLRITPNAAAIRLHRAKARLGTALEGQLDSEKARR